MTQSQGLYKGVADNVSCPPTHFKQECCFSEVVRELLIYPSCSLIPAQYHLLSIQRYEFPKHKKGGGDGKWKD